MKTIYSIARLVERDAPGSGVLDWEVPKQKEIVEIGMFFETKRAAIHWLGIVKDKTLFMYERRLHEECDVLTQI